ncbi:hypothetical protein AAC387_Pa09g2115 [Persea americana]
MKKLDKDDPWHFDQQSKIHCAYCNGAYKQVGFDVPPQDEKKEKQKIIQANLVDLRIMFDSGLPTAELFMGDPVSAGELTAEDNSSGALERYHNTVHMWVGRHKNEKNEPFIDMGDFSTAAKDMLFCGHHSNVDRLWDLYRTYRGKKVVFDNNDWLNAEFIFYDENKEVVKINVMDSLSTLDLVYTYKDVPTPWMQRARPKRPAAKPRSGSFSMVPVTEFGTEPRPLVDAPVRVLVPRPKAGRSQEEKEDENEVIVVDGIEVLDEGPVRFDVFIATPFGNFAGPDYGLPAGSFVKLTHAHKEGHKHRKAKLKLGITRLLEDLKAEKAQKLVVTFVSRTGSVNLGGFHVDLFKADN